jgi:hypothetical protein
MSELESRGVKRPSEMDSDGEQLESPQKQQRLLEDLASEASRASLESVLAPHPQLCAHRLL